MSSAVQHPITIQRYLTFESPEGYHDELIYGRIVVSPEPKPLHFDIAENIYMLLRKAAGKNWKVAQRINLRFEAVHSMPSPDVFVMKKSSWLSARRASQYPDGSSVVLAVEVLSPGNRPKMIQKKVSIYGKHGLTVWVIHPEKKTLQVFEQGRLVDDLSGQALVHLPSQFGNKALKLESIFKLN